MKERAHVGLTIIILGGCCNASLASVIHEADDSKNRKLISRASLAVTAQGCASSHSTIQVDPNFYELFHPSRHESIFFVISSQVL
jgi:hypothetical protein